MKNAPQAESGAVIWSEDFANGIPASWSNFGTPSTAQWEYRGPNTTPSNAQGSRGAWSGINNTPPTNDPIFSPTQSNGFVIFDSDYLDNGGSQAASAVGTGPAPAPHISILETDVIDLSSETDVELKMHTYARRFSVRFFVAFSTDGGTTFNDTIEVMPPSFIGVNISTTNPYELTRNVSQYIGGQSNVVMQFIFDGITGNPGANGDSYYFWMMDDIELRNLPKNQLLFTDWNGAPKQDIIYSSTPGYGPYGHLHVDQIVPITFDGNMYNYGTQTQTNVSMEVEIWDAATASLVTTLPTPGCANLATGDTCNYNDLTTPAWTPPSVGDYIIVFKGISDSISSANTTTLDTITQTVSDSLYSMDRGVQSNFVGTNSANPEILAMAVRFPLVNEDPDSAGAGLVFVDGVTIALSTATDSTADLEFAIYDTTGFPGSPGSPLFTKVHSLSGADPGTNAFFSFQDNNGAPLALPVGNYYLQVTFFPNATDGVVRLLNDASTDGGNTSLMQLADGSWYFGFTSTTYESPWIRLDVAEAPAADVSLKEAEANAFEVYPNPTSGISNVTFEMGGNYNIRMYDMVGNVVRSAEEAVNANEKLQLDFSNLPAGVYLLNVEGEGLNKTVKLTIR